MAFNPQSGHLWLERLCKALGIDPAKRPVRRIVIDAEVDSAVVVYVQEYLDEQPGRETVPDVIAEMREEGLGAVEVRSVKRLDVDERTGEVRAGANAPPYLTEAEIRCMSRLVHGPLSLRAREALALIRARPAAEVAAVLDDLEQLRRNAAEGAAARAAAKEVNGLRGVSSKADGVSDAEQPPEADEPEPRGGFF